MLSTAATLRKRFSLLYLEEGEAYIKDFFVKNVRMWDVVSQSYRDFKDRGGGEKGS